MCLRMVLCILIFFKLSVREEFQFKIFNLSHQVGQIEQFYKDGNCFRICLFIKGLYFLYRTFSFRKYDLYLCWVMNYKIAQKTPDLWIYFIIKRVLRELVFPYCFIPDKYLIFYCIYGIYPENWNSCYMEGVNVSILKIMMTKWDARDMV